MDGNHFVLFRPSSKKWTKILYELVEKFTISAIMVIWNLVTRRNELNSEKAYLRLSFFNEFNLWGSALSSNKLSDYMGSLGLMLTSDWTILGVQRISRAQYDCEQFKKCYSRKKWTVIEFKSEY